MEERMENEEIEVKESYQPRPLWQIVLAWIGVGIVAVAFVIYLYNIASGGAF